MRRDSIPPCGLIWDRQTKLFIDRVTRRLFIQNAVYAERSLCKRGPGKHIVLIFANDAKGVTRAKAAKVAHNTK